MEEPPDDQRDIEVRFAKTRSLGFAAMSTGVLLLVLQFRPSTNPFVTHVLLTGGGLFLLYVGASGVAQAGELALIMKSDGLLIYPVRWLFRRRPGPKFLRWEDIAQMRYVQGKGTQAIHLYTKESPPPRNRPWLFFLQDRPVAKIPFLVLDIPVEDLTRGIRERAWNQGIIIH